MAGRPARARAGASGLAALIWLAFIVFPLVRRGRPTRARAGQGPSLIIGGAALFVAVYVWLVV